MPHNTDTLIYLVFAFVYKSHNCTIFAKLYNTQPQTLSQHILHFNIWLKSHNPTTIHLSDIYSFTLIIKSTPSLHPPTTDNKYTTTSIFGWIIIADTCATYTIHPTRNPSPPLFTPHNHNYTIINVGNTTEQRPHSQQNHTVASSTTTTLLQQPVSLVTATYLILTTLNSRYIPHPTLITTDILSRILTTLDLQTT